MTIQRLRGLSGRLRRDTSGLAMIEFGMMMPIFVVMCVGGSELANYITTKMRMSQIALQIADNAARLGTGSKLAAKTISETDINDVFAGAQAESGTLKLKENGRVILSSLEPIANPNPTNKYKIGWQRCYGTKTAHPSSWGVQGDIRDSMGPSNQPTKALLDNASMFVEVYYVYKPILPGISSRFIPTTTPSEGVTLLETASMALRDRRNLTDAPTRTTGDSKATC